MNRGRVLSAVALVLAVAALGTIAGGLSTGETGPSDTSPGVGIGAGEGSGVENGSGLGFNLSGGTDLGGPAWLGKRILLAIVWGAAVLSGAYARTGRRVLHDDRRRRYLPLRIGDLDVLRRGPVPPARGSRRQGDRTTHPR